VGSFRYILRLLSARVSTILLVGVVLGLLASPTLAQIEDDGSCVYNRRVYPDGYEMCQGGQQVRCEEGSWGDIGMCDEPEPEPPPEAGGGDVDYR
jgi:hypothetical protein